MSNERIFVLVPVYKVEAYLERCIDSILNQTYSNWELVLVDDGSPDNCPAICDRYAAEHENITVIHQENGGLSAARNVGIEYALQKGAPKQDWITFIDSDDFVNPRYLEYLHRAAKETGAEVSSCAYVRTNSSEIPSEEIPFSYKAVPPEEFWHRNRTNALIAPAKLYRLSCLSDVRFPLGKLHEDEFTTYKILFQCSAMAILTAPLYHYFFNSSSITHSEWTPRRLDGLEALEAQVEYFEQHGYPAAHRISAAHLLQHSIKHVMYMKHLSPKYDHLIKGVKARQRRAFRLYAQDVGLKRAIEYWYSVRVKAPLERVLGKESLFRFLKRKIQKKLGLR